MQKVILLMVFAAIAGGSVPPIAKIALEVFPPLTLVMVRFLATALILLPFIWKSKELNTRVFRQLLPVSLIGSINPALLILALQFTPSSVAPLIYASIPLMTALFLHRFRSIKIPPSSFLGILVGFSGVAIIILLPFFQQGDIDYQNLWGNVLILAGAVAFMFNGIVSNDKQQQLKISPQALTFYLSVVTLVLSMPFSLVEITTRPVNFSAVQPRHILSALEIGIIGTGGFYLAYQNGLKAGNQLTASLFTYIQPLATIGFAIVLLGEEITLPYVIGGTLALIGAGLASNVSANRRKIAAL